MKHIIITKLFEFGGSNTHLSVLIKYFGKENIILILEDKNQLSYLNNIPDANGIKVIIKSNLHPYAHLRYRFKTNLKEFLCIIKSIIEIQILSIRFGFADVTVSAVEPERLLYLLWIPFSKIIYILHTEPNKRYTSFTSYTCNTTLGKRKRILTVSYSNKHLICENWDIVKKRHWIRVVYNCIIKNEMYPKAISSKVNDEQRIITLGHVIAYKNPYLWLEVAKQVTSMRKNVHFIWLGNGPLWDDFKTATLGFTRISFEGTVANQHTYLKEATIYYQPSLSETQGIAVVEAMYNNLPCVVANIGGLPECVKNNHNGILVDPYNLNENINAITVLLNSDKLRKSYGSNSFERYKDLFTFDKFKIQMDEIYNN